MIRIRELQHFLYCPHRWKMLYSENMWQGNPYTVIAEIAHTRVHSGNILTKSKNITSLSDVTVYSEKLGIYGKTDCIELIKDDNGVAVYGFEGKYFISVIEYKPSMPKEKNFSAERLQLFAQVCCVEELFKIKPSSFFYFYDKKMRYKVDFDDNDKKLLEDTILKINEAKEKDIFPSAVYGVKCNGCSLKDYCMPKPGYKNTKQIILGEIE